MYLVQRGHEITFTVKTQGAEKHPWQVDKKVQDKERMPTVPYRSFRKLRFSRDDIDLGTPISGQRSV